MLLEGDSNVLKLLVICMDWNQTVEKGQENDASKMNMPPSPVSVDLFDLSTLISFHVLIKGNMSFCQMPKLGYYLTPFYCAETRDASFATFS